MKGTDTLMRSKGKSGKGPKEEEREGGKGRGRRGEKMIAKEGGWREGKKERGRGEG